MKKHGVRIMVMVGVLASTLVGRADIGSQVTEKTDVTVTNAATLVLASNAFRSALNCTNNSASVNVRWGGSGVTASTGQRIPFGASIEIANKDAIYMISEGANVTVSCTEETR